MPPADKLMVSLSAAGRADVIGFRGALLMQQPKNRQGTIASAPVTPGNGKRPGKGHDRAFMRAIRPRAPALRHGGTLRLSEAELTAACAEIIRAAPHLQQARYRLALESLTRLWARLHLMDAIIANHPKGWAVRATGSGRLEINAGEKYYLSVTEQVRRLLNDLGLTPSAARGLGLDVAAPDQRDITKLLAALPPNGGTGARAPRGKKKLPQ